MDGRFSVSLDDVRKVAVPVLRHRISTNFQAQAEGQSTDTLVKRLVSEIREPDPPKYERTGALRGSEARSEAKPVIEMSNKPRQRWGILGCARIARRGLIPGIRASETGTLHAHGQSGSGHRTGLGRGIRGPQGLRILPGASRRPRGRRGLHPLAQRTASALGSGRGRRRQAGPVREAAGPRRPGSRSHGGALPAPGRRPDGSLHVAAPTEDAGAPRARQPRRDWRPAADPVVILVPDRAGRLAARPIARWRCALGRRLLRREYGPTLRRERAVGLSSDGPVRSAWRQHEPYRRAGVSRRRARHHRLQLRTAIPVPL